MLRIGIIGYGRMGLLLRQTAEAKGHTVPVIIDPYSKAAEVTAREIPSSLEHVDVMIDFSAPGAVVSNIIRYSELGVAAVIGTTGWYSDMDRVVSIVEESGIGLIWSGNFSLGVNLFFQMIASAGEVMNRFSQYDVMVHEQHHKNKIDSPSGTAEMIGKILIDALDRKNTIVTTALNRQIGMHELHISSTRGGSIPGTHQVIFDSDIDTIVLEHMARSRSGFAEGALLAAEWIQGKCGLYHINEMMHSIIGGRK